MVGSMPEDVIRGLGYLTLGSRLKRLGERLQGGVQELCRRQRFAIQAGHFPVLAALDGKAPVPIGELARAIGVSQPAITRTVGLLAKGGLVAISRAGKDQRRSPVMLTAKGRKLLAGAKRDLWPFVEASVREMCEPLAGSLLDQLAGLEAALKAAPLDRRVIAKRNGDGTHS